VKTLAGKNKIVTNQGFKGENENKTLDYSDLVRAVREGDEATANRMCSEALPILKKYLISNLNATPEDAEDAVQKMFEYVISKIIQGEIKNPGGILSYMLTGSRHAYLKSLRNIELEVFDELISEPFSGPDQFEKLLREEQKNILKGCIEKLDGHYRSMCEFILENPSANSVELAEKFNISVNNAWIRKHRLIKQLSECAKKQM
jgi:DNA-directed RNA polymerase specialized sigma24 family protein